MACPGGCVAGAGTLAPVDVAAKEIQSHKQISTIKHALERDYQTMLDMLEEKDLKLEE